MSNESLWSEHPHYCVCSRYMTWQTMTDFLASLDNSPENRNLVFRWDAYNDPERPDLRYVEVFTIYQHTGRGVQHRITKVDDHELVSFRKFIEKHWHVMKEIWAPLSNEQENENVGG